MNALEIAQNPNTTPETLAALVALKSGWIGAKFEIRLAVAQNPNTSKETLVFLSKDVRSRVRIAVAQNPNTSKETLVFLSKDVDFRIVEIALSKRQKHAFFFEN